MPRRLPGWQQWETDLQEMLGLDATICSGNQWQDTGDAVDNTNPRDNGFRLLVDGKYTDGVGWPVPMKTVHQWLETAVEKGRRGMVAVRSWPRGQFGPRDYVILDANDFAELYEKAKLYDKALVAHLNPGDASLKVVP